MSNHTGTSDHIVHSWDKEVDTEAAKDDAAVDRFATAMRQKLARSREKGRGGWQTCPPDDLREMLTEHIQKGDPVDVANLAMMLWHRGERT